MSLPGRRRASAEHHKDQKQSDADESQDGSAKKPAWSLLKNIMSPQGPNLSNLKDLPHDYFPGADVKALVLQRVNDDLARGFWDSPPADGGLEYIEDIFKRVVYETNVILTKTTRNLLLKAIIADLIGLSLLEPLLEDPEITEIIVVGHLNIFVIRRGKLEPAPTHFDDEEHLRRIIDRLAAPMGKRIDAQSPMVDVRLPDGTLVNAVIPPMTHSGSVLVIHKPAA